MLSSSWITDFCDHQYLLKKLIDVLDILHRDLFFLAGCNKEVVENHEKENSRCLTSHFKSTFSEAAWLITAVYVRYTVFKRNGSYIENSHLVRLFR